jgi:hypothetical protein
MLEEEFWLFSLCLFFWLLPDVLLTSMAGCIWIRPSRILWAVRLSAPLEEPQLARSLETRQQERLLALLPVRLQEQSAVCPVLAIAMPLRLHRRMNMQLLHRRPLCIINHLRFIMLHHPYITRRDHTGRIGGIGTGGSAMMVGF